MNTTVLFGTGLPGYSHMLIAPLHKPSASVRRANPAVVFRISDLPLTTWLSGARPHRPNRSCFILNHRLPSTLTEDGAAASRGLRGLRNVRCPFEVCAIRFATNVCWYYAFMHRTATFSLKHQKATLAEA